MENKTTGKWLRYVCLAVGEAFCVGTLIYALAANLAFSKATICLLSILCMLAPEGAERFLKIKIPTPLYIFIIAYSLCPTLGHTYKFYAIIPCWDTILHATGGVVFALLGVYLPHLIQKDGKCGLWICALFGLLFSVSVSVAWEIIEYSCDVFVGSDMQQDTIINGFHSYALGNGLEIREVFYSGEIAKTVLYDASGNVLWTIDGYIDTGILDTMTDVIWETIGAVAYTVVFVLDKGKHVGLIAPQAPTKQKEEA